MTRAAKTKHDVKDGQLTEPLAEGYEVQGLPADEAEYLEWATTTRKLRGRGKKPLRPASSRKGHNKSA